MYADEAGDITVISGSNAVLKVLTGEQLTVSYVVVDGMETVAVGGKIKDVLPACCKKKCEEGECI